MIMAIVRPASEEDWPRIKVLVGWCEKELADLCQQPFGGEVLLAAISRVVGTGVGCWVVEDDDQVVQGYICWSLVGDTVHGLGTYLVPSLRGKRYSDELRQVASEYWATHGGKRVQGVVREENKAGWFSVERVGFKVVGYLVEKELSH